MPYTLEIEEKTDSPTINIALDTIEKGKQALVFVNTKRSAEKAAEDIAKKIKTISMPKLSESILKVLGSPTRQCKRLSKCVEKGIAFHHAGLTSKQREIIEDNFREGKIKIICCTPTLAAGLDMPAFRTLIKDLKRYGGGSWGMSEIPVLEYLQMAGRAGRPGKEEYGEAICIAQSESSKEEIYFKYVTGEPESIYSKLAVEPVLRTYLLSLISTGFVNSYDEIIAFFEKTFWAYQFQDMEKLKKIINRMLGLLQEFNFIRMSQKDIDFISAKDIVEDKITATKLGERVAQLYIDPLTAHKLIEELKVSNITKKTTPFAYIQMICSTLELRPYLKVKAKEFETIQKKFAKYEDEILQELPEIYDEEYDYFLNSVKTALFMADWIDEKQEEYLLETYDIRPGETRAKLEKAKWLLYASEELAKILNLKPVLKHIARLKMRLKHGVKEELLALLKLSGVGRIRARKLYANKIKDLGDVKKTDITVLAQIVGKALATKIKEQLGQEVKPIKENKRKGQVSLMDF